MLAAAALATAAPAGCDDGEKAPRPAPTHEVAPAAPTLDDAVRTFERDVYAWYTPFDESGEDIGDYIEGARELRESLGLLQVDLDTIDLPDRTIRTQAALRADMRELDEDLLAVEGALRQERYERVLRLDRRVQRHLRAVRSGLRRLRRAA